MWVFESCGYVFSKLKFCGYLKLWVFKNCGYSNLWVHKICDDKKFQVNDREYQNICVLCISCEQKNICAFFHICFLPYVQNMPCELALKAIWPTVKMFHGFGDVHVMNIYEPQRDKTFLRTF